MYVEGIVSCKVFFPSLNMGQFWSGPKRALREAVITDDSESLRTVRYVFIHATCGRARASQGNPRLN